MTIRAQVSASEVYNILANRYVDQYFEARLINLPAYNYVPGVSGADATLLAGEVTVGSAGYQRVILSWSSSEVGSYADGGITLAPKAATFAQDNGPTPLTFSHVALVWSSGNVLTLGTPTSVPASATPTTEAYTNIPIDSTDGSGVGLTVDLEVGSGGGANGASDFTITINRPGYGYAATDNLTILNSTLATLDASISSGDLTFPVSTVYTPDAAVASAGDLFSEVKTTSTVNLTSGSEVAFYWNVKQFGFYTAP